MCNGIEDLVQFETQADFFQEQKSENNCKFKINSNLVFLDGYKSGGR